MIDQGKLNSLIQQMAERRTNFHDVHNFGDTVHWSETDEWILISLCELQSLRQNPKQEESRLTKEEKNENGEAELKREVFIWSGASAFQEAIEKLWKLENLEEGIKICEKD